MRRHWTVRISDKIATLWENVVIVGLSDNIATLWEDIVIVGFSDILPHCGRSLLL